MYVPDNRKSSSISRQAWPILVTSNHNLLDHYGLDCLWSSYVPPSEFGDEIGSRMGHRNLVKS